MTNFTVREFRNGAHVPTMNGDFDNYRDAYDDAMRRIRGVNPPQGVSIYEDDLQIEFFE